MNPVNYTPREARNGYTTDGTIHYPSLVMRDAPARSRLSPALTPLAIALVKRVTAVTPKNSRQPKSYEETKTKKSTLGYIRMLRMRKPDL